VLCSNKTHIQHREFIYLCQYTNQDTRVYIACFRHLIEDQIPYTKVSKDTTCTIETTATKTLYSFKACLRHLIKDQHAKLKASRSDTTLVKGTIFINDTTDTIQTTLTKGY
jgi:hypothetical protein